MWKGRKSEVLKRVCVRGKQICVGGINTCGGLDSWKEKGVEVEDDV